MPHTNITKLIYAAPTPKNTPTKKKVKSTHHYVNKISRRMLKDIDYQDEVKIPTIVKNDLDGKTISDEEFLKKRLECKKDSEDLNEITGKQFEKTEKNCDLTPLKEKNSNIKTQSNLDEPKAHNNGNPEILSKNSVSALRSFRSTLNIKENQTEVKKKSYNSDEAKQFIKTQRERWKIEEKTNLLNQKEKLEKDEIKKRLQELHKNTLKILESNLRIKSKKRSRSFKPTETSGKNESQIKTRKLCESNQNIAKCTTYKDLNKLRGVKKTNNSNLLPLIKSSEKIGKIETSKRIGLLRKADTDEPSFSNIKDYDINRGNEMLKSLVTLKVNLPSNVCHDNNTNILNPNTEILNKVDPENNSLQVKTQNEINIDANSKLENIKKNITNDNIPKDVEIQTSLQIPKAKLESKILERDKTEKSVQVQISQDEHKENIFTTKKTNKSDEIPYWLKQTPVEIYPYNFITAVRKKLEALTVPITQQPSAHQRKKKINKKNSNIPYQETPLSHIKTENENVRRRIIDNDNSIESNSNQTYSQTYNTSDLSSQNNVGVDIDILNGKKNNEVVTEKSHSVSEMISNFSSISLHVPESNTISDISSLKSDMHVSKAREKDFLKNTKNHSLHKNEYSGNDDTTISSSVFSSPEKKNSFDAIKQPLNTEDSFISEKSNPSLSPLSLENITDLQVKSKNQKTVSEMKEDLMVPKLSLNFNSTRKTVQEHTMKKTIQNEQKILELDQLLVDFNKSLSQVIEVNNQLKNTLDKSQKNFSPNSQRNHLNYEYNGIPIVSKPSVSSFTTVADYTSDFEDDASNVTLTCVQSGQNISVSKDNPPYEENLISEEIISSKSLKQNLKRADSIEANQNVQNLSETHSTLQNDSKILGNQTSKSDIVESGTSSTIAEDISEITIEENTQNVIVPSQDLYNPIESTNVKDKENDFSNDLDGKYKYFGSHINMARGSDNVTVHTQRSIISTNRKGSTVTDRSSALPIYSDDKKTEKQNQFLDSSIGNEFIAVYNKSDVEISMFLQEDNQSVASETTLNYSSIGMYEQLLHAENLKSEQLTALLKMREKVLIDRTKGQIAWLQVQKEKYKSKGLSEQITAVKKKQRAILMKMEKEREEIKRLMNNQGLVSGNQSSKIKSQHQSTLLKNYRPKLSDSISNITIRKGFSTTISQSQSSAKIVRGFDIGSSQNLEKILQKREEELKTRRQHVERLMAWHQRLDKEEQEVLQLEQMLLECNKNNWQTSPQITREVQPIVSEEQFKTEKKIAEIEKSLKELQNISVCSTENPDIIIDQVRITGHKLNKLWSRLTGQKINKFDPHKKYKLTKEDLEKFYEKAKEKVIEEFNKEHNLGKLLEQSSNEKVSNLGINSSNERNDIDTILLHGVDVPSLHLNFSSDTEESHTLKSTPINEEEKNMNKQILENYLSAIEKSELERVSDESLNEHNTVLLSHELPEEDTQQSKNLNIKYSEVNQKIENLSNIIKNIPQNSSSDTKSEILTKTDVSEKRETTFKIQKQPVKALTPSNVQQNVSGINFSPINSLDKTFVLKTNSPDVQSSPEKQASSQDSAIESNKISEHIKGMQSSTDSILSEINRPSVIVSLTSNLSSDLTKSSKIKTDSILVETKTGISSQTKIESNEKHTPTIVSINSSLQLSNNKTLSPDQSTSGTTYSTNNSTKPPSSISLENAFNYQLNSISPSTTIESILPSIDRQTFISTTLSLEENQTLSEILNTEKTLEKNLEYSYEYDNDFSGSDLTNLEDITIPKFETTIETTRTSLDVEQGNSNRTENSSESSVNTTELEKRLIDLDDSLKDLNTTIEKVLSPEKESAGSSKKNSSGSSMVSVTIATMKSAISETVTHQPNNSLSTIITNSTSDYDKITLMPDIISEVEIRRRQQILIESEIKQLEHAMPYVVFREIPNKPPPPYVPPAHGSPMTTIFPSESRIKEITYRRTAELFEELSKKNETNNIENSILNEQITNIYERIILDICKECMQEYEATLNDLNPESYKNPLAFYNPPDRLNCMQEFIYRRVRKLLAMEKNYQKKNSILSIGRKKRDHVDEILIQELFEEEDKWTNFDTEEDEVKTSIVEEILNGVIKDVVIEAVNRSEKNDNDATNLNIENDNVQEENKSLIET